MLDPHLTKPQGEELAAMQAATVPGMAFWAGSGPAGRTCRECVHWSASGRYIRHRKGNKAKRPEGSLKDQRCDKYARLSYGREGDKLGYHTPACRYFEALSEDRPAMMRWAGKHGWQPIDTPAAP